VAQRPCGGKRGGCAAAAGRMSMPSMHRQLHLADVCCCFTSAKVATARVARDQT
jgi:hypothetical protein